MEMCFAFYFAFCAPRVLWQTRTDWH